ncbi:UNVERIFIED_CONTAM: hypothetical protein Scaly_2573600 [Sesamum calycinum]|uniref:Uncharacterized protein n=1 Tax=Sesamum calycinum TaxID=2727403 RepID=A0AAW2JIR2_9LAMI
MVENQSDVSTANTSINRSRQVVEILEPMENTADDSDELDEQIRTDYMVITWILNTVSKEILYAFIYVSLAKSLWLELKVRYGGSNGPMIYNLEQEIASVSQAEIPITAFFTKIKILWDKVVCLDPVPACTYPVHRQIIKRKNSHQLMRSLGPISRLHNNRNGWMDDCLVERCKARLVAKGFNQIEGVDYADYFSPIEKAVIMRFCWLLAPLSVGPYINWMPTMLFSMVLLIRRFTCNLPRGIQFSLGHVCPPLEPVLCRLSMFRIYFETLVYRMPRLQPSLFRRVLSFVPLEELLYHTLNHIEDLWVACYTWGSLGTTATSLFFPSSSSLKLQAYCDADWASCLDSRRSVTRFRVFLGNALVSWNTRSWPRSLVRLLRRSTKATIHIMANPVFHERTKYLDIDCQIVRNQYKIGFVAPSFVRSKEQLADIFTKSLFGPLFLDLLSKLALFTLARSFRAV